MSSESEVDTEQTVVQTYVPAYQRDAWDEHAEQLEMSRSEFVKTMVQAGRRGFGAETRSDGADSDAGGGDLEERIVEGLRESGPLSWEELFAEVTDDIETRLEAALQRLQDENRIKYSGPEGGYVLEEPDR